MRTFCKPPGHEKVASIVRLSLSSIPWYQYSLLLCFCLFTVSTLCLCVSWYQGMAWDLPIRREWKSTRLELGLKGLSWHFLDKIDMLWPSSFQRVVSHERPCPGSIDSGSISSTVSWFSEVAKRGPLLGSNKIRYGFINPSFVDS